jgi:hypothetical protein
VEDGLLQLKEGRLFALLNVKSAMEIILAIAVLHAERFHVSIETRIQMLRRITAQITNGTGNYAENNHQMYLV